MYCRLPIADCRMNCRVSGSRFPIGNRKSEIGNRGGATLTEVLVSIFIMGIGLLSLLVLFPVGALNMASAIKDERTADAARIAAALARILHDGATSDTGGIRDDAYVYPAYCYVDFNPNNVLYPIWPEPGATLPAPGSGTASYPVYVDPVGYSLNSTRMGYLPPGGLSASVGFARVCPASMYIPTPGAPGTAPIAGTISQARINRWMTIPDDMVFDDDGRVKLLPAIGGAPPQPLQQQLQREPRYSFAFLCRQVRAQTTTPPPWPRSGGTNPPYNTTTKHMVDVTVVVYDRRPNLAVSVGPYQVPVEEKSYALTIAAGSNLAYISWPAGTPAPSVRRGTWILDATVVDTTHGPHGYFYRVANVTQLPNNILELQLQQNAKAGVSSPNGVAVVMDSVAEVFERFTN